MWVYIKPCQMDDYELKYICGLNNRLLKTLGDTFSKQCFIFKDYNGYNIYVHKSKCIEIKDKDLKEFKQKVGIV